MPSPVLLIELYKVFALKKGLDDLHVKFHVHKCLVWLSKCLQGRTQWDLCFDEKLHRENTTMQGIIQEKLIRLTPKLPFGTKDTCFPFKHITHDTVAVIQVGTSPIPD